MQPNFFDYYPQKLNQDTFIMWLFEFANPKYKLSNSKLHNCAKAFLTLLIQKQFPSFNTTIDNVEIGMQSEGIDIWAKINKKFLLVIADNTTSRLHRNPLIHCKEKAEEWCIANKYEFPICIYLQTGNESQTDFNHIATKGYSVFNRLDFINFLEDFKSVSNYIFKSFFQKLKKLERQNIAFQNKTIKNWNDIDWQGFYKYLEQEIYLEDWGYLCTSFDSSLYATLITNYWSNYPVQINLFKDKLYFEISISPDEIETTDELTAYDIGNQFCRSVLNKANQLGYRDIQKMERTGSLIQRRVAVVNCEHWLGNTNRKINKVEILNKLKEYITLLNKVAKLSF